jgi:hypothetical protein
LRQPSKAFKVLRHTPRERDSSDSSDSSYTHPSFRPLQSAQKFQIPYLEKKKKNLGPNFRFLPSLRQHLNGAVSKIVDPLSAFSASEFMHNLCIINRFLHISSHIIPPIS